MRHFCTLFDVNYLAKGLALHDSLVRHSVEPFTLHILAMDMETFWILSEMNLDNVEVIPMESFEKALNMPAVRKSRSWTEYCWTCASSLMEYLLPRCDALTYLDADVFFFSNPAPIFAQIANRSIAITPHRLPENSQKIRLEQNGKYNVGFVYFANTFDGRSCLHDWASAVRARCLADVGCGDQVYLDAFEQGFGDAVAVLGHGINAGPWNVSAYEVTQYDGQVFLGRDPLYCYHFHEYIHGKRLTNYPLMDRDVDLIYRPYISAIGEANLRIWASNLTIAGRRSEMVERGA